MNYLEYRSGRFTRPGATDVSDLKKIALIDSSCLVLLVLDLLACLLRLLLEVDDLLVASLLQICLDNESGEIDELLDCQIVLSLAHPHELTVWRVFLVLAEWIVGWLPAILKKENSDINIVKLSSRVAD